MDALDGKLYGTVAGNPIPSPLLVAFRIWQPYPRGIVNAINTGFLALFESTTILKLNLNDLLKF